MKDIKLTTDYDLEIKNGDFVVDNSDYQSAELLLQSNQGDWKFSSLTGCNLQKAHNGQITRMLDRHIRVQLEADGFDLDNMKITDKGMFIKGKYKE